MLIHENLKAKIKEIYSDEKDDMRVTFNWVEDRFILEFGENDGCEKFAEYINCTDQDDLECVLKEKLKNEEILKFIDDQEKDETDINNQWKNKAENFIKVLSRYRKNGGVDPNQTQQLMNFAKNINNDSLRYIYEIIQNADDCNYDKNSTPSITLDLSEEDKMIISYNETGMIYSDIIALTTVGQSNKKNRLEKRLIGEKGIGFKTIFSACESVDIFSGGFKFRLKDNSFAPEYIDENNNDISGTMLVLYFPNNKEDSNQNGKLNIKDEDIFKSLKRKYGVENSDGKFCKQEAFKNCPIFFTEKIKAITVKGKNDTFSIECDTDYTIIYKDNDNEIGKIECYSYDKNVEFTFEEYSSRYKNQFKNEDDFNDYKKSNGDKTAITYPIRIIVSKDTDVIKEGNLYSYLPTYTNIKAPYNIQLPIKLNLDRSSIWFEGDEDTDGNGKKDNESMNMLKWNERLFDEMFFCKSALIKNMYNDLKQEEKEKVFKYIPSFAENNHMLFKAANKHADNNNSIERLNKYNENHSLFDVYKNITYFKVYSNNNIDKCGSESYCTAEKAIMFDQFIYNNFYEEYYQQLSKDERQDKFLVEYNKDARDKANSFGFKLFDVKEDDDKIKYLNNVLKGKEEPVLEECKKDKKERSKYLPSDISKLNIFPARNIDGEVRYTTHKDNFWFKAESYFGSDGNICFLHKELDNVGLLKDLEFMSSKKIEDVWCGLWKKIDELKNKCNKELFIELIELVSKHVQIQDKNDWYSYTKAILENNENKSNKFWNKDRTDNLITLINANVGEFVGGEKDE